MELKPEEHPDIDGMIRAIREKNLHRVAGKFGNVLELVTAKKYPVIGEIEQVMRGRCGAVNAMMSGSGPTVFGLFTNPRAAEAAYEALRFGKHAKLAKQVYLTGFLQRETRLTYRRPMVMENNFKVNMNEYLPLRDVVFNTLRQAILKGSWPRGAADGDSAGGEAGREPHPHPGGDPQAGAGGSGADDPSKGAEVAKISEKSLQGRAGGAPFPGGAGHRAGMPAHDRGGAG